VTSGSTATNATMHLLNCGVSLGMRGELMFINAYIQIFDKAYNSAHGRDFAQS